MKRIINTLIILIILTLPVCVAAQVFFSPANGSGETKLVNPQTIVGKVFYNFSYVKDRSRPNSLVHEDFELDFAKSASMFTSYSTRLRDSAIEETREEQTKRSTVVRPDGSISITGSYKEFAPPRNQSFSRDKFYTDIKDSGQCIRIINLVDSVYLIKDSAHKINWHIWDSTKTIQGNLCKKATGKSHGRTYTAWFCSNIPYRFGPRRLNGLPGLILEAYDAKREVVYTLDHIETVNSTNENIGLPGNGIPSTPKGFIKSQEKFQRTPDVFWPPMARGMMGEMQSKELAKGMVLAQSSRIDLK